MAQKKIARHPLEQDNGEVKEPEAEPKIGSAEWQAEKEPCSWRTYYGKSVTPMQT